MNDQDLGRLLKRIFQWAMASAIIGAVAVVLIIVMNWENSPLRGWHLVKNDPPPKAAPAECNCETPAKIAPRSRPIHRHVAAPPEPVVEQTEAEPESEQAAPVPATNANLQSWPPRYEAAPVVQYNVVVIAPKKHHRWPRRFFGAVGRGLGKVIGVR